MWSVRRLGGCWDGGWGPLVQCYAEVFLSHGYECIEIESEVWSSVRRNEFMIQLWFDGHFYTHQLSMETIRGVPLRVKFKSGGRARFPFARPLVSGRRVAGSRRSSKNSWVRASRAWRRAVGVYCNKLLRRSMTSGPTCRRKIYPSQQLCCIGRGGGGGSTLLNG